ncbi:hypothetical protein ACOME3_000101 [Neoechinorhynchus agilis]
MIVPVRSFSTFPAQLNIYASIAMRNNESINAELERRSTLVFIRLITSYACILIGLPGIFGNVIIIIASLVDKLTSINAYMIALSASNTIFLVLWLSTNSLKYVIAGRFTELFKAQYDNYHWYSSLCIRLQWISLPLINITQLCFILLTTMISIDRCICLRYSLRSLKYGSVKTSLVAIFVIFVFSIAYCMPSWFEYSYAVHDHYAGWNNGAGNTGKLARYHLILTPFGIKHQKLLHSYLYIPVLYLIPFIAITFSNVMIIRQVIKLNRRMSMVASRTDRRLTYMIILIMATFFLCQFPVLVLNILSVNDKFIVDSNNQFALNILRCACEVLIVTNGSTNFTLYCWCSRPFMQTIYNVITFRRRPTAVKPRIRIRK